MIVIVCLDDNNGMLFNHRRQSQDRILLERIIQSVTGYELFINEYSQKLFSGKNIENLCVCNQFLEDAAPGDYCFVEDQPLLPYAEKIEKIIVYRWNRVYPHDMKLDLSLEEWSLLSTAEFAGSSHDKITEEVYTR